MSVQWWPEVAVRQMALWPDIRVTTKPTHAPVTISQAKRFCDYDEDDRDSEFDGWVQTATEAVEHDCERAFVTQTCKAYWPAFQQVLRIQKPPIPSITSVEYVDEDGATQTLSASVYQSNLFSTPPTIREAYNQCWPNTKCDTDNAVIVTFVAGYGDAFAVPERAKQAILVRVKRMFDGCGDVSGDMVYQGLITGLRWRLV